MGYKSVVPICCRFMFSGDNGGGRQGVELEVVRLMFKAPAPGGAPICWFVAIFLLAETSYRCVATSLYWSVFISTSESPASPVMSLRSGPPVTT